VPNFTENSWKEFEKFTENSLAPQPLFRGAILMQTKKSHRLINYTINSAGFKPAVELQSSL